MDNVVLVSAVQQSEYTYMYLGLGFSSHTGHHSALSRVPCAYLLNPTLKMFPLSVSGINQFSSVTQSCPTLCDPMNPSTPGLPVRHQLPEFTQTHIQQVGDAIQPSHRLSSPSPPAPHPSQHQSLFQ